ncbi:hypothetical protein [Streptomyces xanthophaeus]|uniref:Uncharacterized protein n=1 Tax=Streptomyces xanthophaeus TaxID=67385 RepID=A0A919GTZ7_9ACTN|nr:hypothetical protein [Streptomyces xanthophaeus]GHI84145.1 hypothetical protein Sxan_15090 [Streptomyces xanthophaeus]
MSKSTSSTEKSGLLRQLLRDAAPYALRGAAFKLGAAAVTLLILWIQAM